MRMVLGRYQSTSTPRIKAILIGTRGVTALERPTSSGGDSVGPSIFGTTEQTRR